MATSERLCLLLFIIVAYNTIINSKKVDQSTVISGIKDVKEFKKLLRTKTNILVLFTKSEKQTSNILSVFRSVANSIKGEGTLVHVDCSSESKALCKKLKIFPEPYILKHYKEGEFHKDYDRKETEQSMITFMRNPTGDIPWEEDETAVDVLHVSDPLGLEKLLTKETKPILMMFYAPWCGFCKKLKPEYIQAAKELRKTAILGAMDVNKPENAAIRHHFNITGFPTLLYFERGRAPHTYEGDNNKDALVNFMKNPHQPQKKPKEQEWHETPSDVVHLGDSTFDAYLANEPSVLVMFYAPWCGHCKAMKPEYVDAASKLKSEKIPGSLVAVDATKETGLATKFGIKGYPTVKYFKNGEFAFDVSLRTADKIIEFIKEPKVPPPPPPPETQWHETENKVWHLQEDTFRPFLKKKKHALVMFYAPWCGHCKKAKPEYERAAERLQEDVQVAFAAVDCTVHTSLCNSHQIQGFPTIKYFNYLKHSTDYDGERTEEGFVNFLSSPSKTISKPTSTGENSWMDEEGCKDIVFLNTQDFHAFVESKESVLVLFYTPDCGYCKMLKPFYAEAATILKNEQVNCVLAAVDASEHPLLATEHEIQGYPTLKYFRQGQERAIYDGERTTKGLCDFMRNPPVSKTPSNKKIEL